MQRLKLKLFSPSPLMSLALSLPDSFPSIFTSFTINKRIHLLTNHLVPQTQNQNQPGSFSSIPFQTSRPMSFSTLSTSSVSPPSYSPSFIPSLSSSSPHDPFPPIKFSVLQLCSSIDISSNLSLVSALVEKSAKKGAKLIFTPECTTKIGATPRENSNDNVVSSSTTTLGASMYTMSTHPCIPFFTSLSKQHGVYLFIGSIAVLPDDHADNGQSQKCHNRSLVFSPYNGLIAQYDKIHLFDVNINDKVSSSSSSHRSSSPTSISTTSTSIATITPPSSSLISESSRILPGHSLTLLSLPHIHPHLTFGLSICYDIRFPYLYRDVIHHGATVLLIPAAFTVPTGELHWEILLRSRAIENECMVIAAAQSGGHNEENEKERRDTWGHSMIVGSDGKVKRMLQREKNEILMGEIEMKEVDVMRSKIPSWGVKGVDGEKKGGYSIVHVVEERAEVGSVVNKVVKEGNLKHQ